MKDGKTYLYYGIGRGKTSLAIGQGIRAVNQGLSVVMVQFLDYNHNNDYEYLKEFEPKFRAFRFEKERESIESADLNELTNEVRLGFNFSKKIIETGESDVLILDGVTNAVDKGFITDEELSEIISRKSDNMDIIMTGDNKFEKIAEAANYIYSINIEKKE